MIPSLVQYQQHLQNNTVDEEMQEETPLSSPSNDSGSDYYQPAEDIHLMNSAEFCNLIWDLALTKGQAELLCSRLKEFHFIAPGTTTSHIRHRHMGMQTRYSKYCCFIVSGIAEWKPPLCKEEFASQR